MAGKKTRKATKARTWAAVAVALVVLTGLAFLAPWAATQAEIGTAFGARTACVCHHIGGRPLDDCRKDFEAGMALIAIEENHDAGTVRASMPLMGDSVARYREGWGCVLEPYEG